MQNTSKSLTAKNQVFDVTLVELAQLLQVSPSTISRALNRPDMVSAQMRERVLAAVNEHSYRPNGIARSLRKGETQTVGLVVSDLQNPFYSGIAKAIENRLSAAAFSCIICDASESQGKEQRALQLMGELRVSGIIHGFSGSGSDELERLGLDGIPIVEIDRASGMRGTDTVLLDNVTGARAAVEHLICLGHTSIGMISGPPRLTTGAGRLEGYTQALESAGIKPNTSLIAHGDFREESGRAAAHKLLAESPHLTALFIANNEMAAGALSAVQELGLTIPHDLSLVAFDDVRWARYVNPPLTVVAQPLKEMGHAAAELLLQRLAGRTSTISRVFQPSLVVRRSTGPPNGSAQP